MVDHENLIDQLAALQYAIDNECPYVNGTIAPNGQYAEDDYYCTTLDLGCFGEREAEISVSLCIDDNEYTVTVDLAEAVGEIVSDASGTLAAAIDALREARDSTAAAVLPEMPANIDEAEMAAAIAIILCKHDPDAKQRILNAAASDCTAFAAPTMMTTPAARPDVIDWDDIHTTQRIEDSGTLIGEVSVDAVAPGYWIPSIGLVTHVSDEDDTYTVVDDSGFSHTYGTTNGSTWVGVRDLWPDCYCGSGPTFNADAALVETFAAAAPVSL